MPISFLTPAAPVPPAGAGAATDAANADAAALFGSLLSGLTLGGGSSGGEPPTEDETAEGEETAVAGPAPSPAAMLVGLNLPIADARAAALATGPAPVRAPQVVPTPTGGTAPAGRFAVPAGFTPVAPADAAPAFPLIPGAPAATPSTVEAPAATAGATALAPAAANGAGQESTSNPDRGEGQVARGPETAWGQPLVAPRADGVAATTPAAPVPPTPHLPPAAQLALRLAPLRTGADGTHQMTIHLNPDELGPISVVAHVKGGELSVQFTGSTDAGREALRAALPQLERELRDGGFSTLAVNVREAPQLNPAERPAWASAATQGSGTATDKATNGNGTTTFGAKTETQPIGQIGRPDGSGATRRDDGGIGQYNSAGQVTAAHQAASASQPNSSQPNSSQPNSTGQQSPQQPAQLNLNLGQPGNQPGAGQYGPADQEGGQQPGTGRDGGSERQAGQPGSGDREQRTTDHRPADDRTGTRSVDLRV